MLNELALKLGSTLENMKLITKRYLVLLFIFTFLFGLLLTFGKVQQTVFPIVPIEPIPITFVDFGVSFIISGILTLLIAVYVPLLNLIPKSQQELIKALDNAPKPVTTPYSIIQLVPGLSKATGYRHVQKLIAEGIIVKNRAGHYVVSKSIKL